MAKDGAPADPVLIFRSESGAREALRSKERPNPGREADPMAKDGAPADPVLIFRSESGAGEALRFKERPNPGREADAMAKDGAPADPGPRIVTLRTPPGRMGLVFEFVKEGTSLRPVVAKVEGHCPFRSKVKEGDRLLSISGLAVTTPAQLMFRSEWERELVFERPGAIAPRPRTAGALLTRESAHGDATATEVVLGGTTTWMSKRPSALQQRMDEKLQQTQPRSVLEKMDEKLQRMDRPKHPVIERLHQKLQLVDPPEEAKEEAKEEAREEARAEEFRHQEEVATRVVSNEELRAWIHKDATIFLKVQQVPTKEVSAEEEVRSKEETEETKNASVEEAKEERIEETKDSAVEDTNVGLPSCDARADEAKEEGIDEASVEEAESGGGDVFLLTGCRGEDASLARWAIDHVTEYQWDVRRNYPDERLAKWAVRHLADESPREEAEGLRNPPPSPTADSILDREIDLGNSDPSDVPDGITHYEGTHFDADGGAGGFLGAFKGMFRK